MSKKVGTKKTVKKAVCKKTVQSSPVCTYDFTLFDDITSSQVIDTLKAISKKYCFQKEKGEKSGKEHFQGRFSLMLKKREVYVIKLLKEKYEWDKFHISITSKENRSNNFYVSKEETRIEGPFTEKDEDELPMPDDVADMKTLRPWQSSLIKELERKDYRTIDVIYDPNGNSGKTSIVKYMMHYKLAKYIPPVNDYQGIMRMACNLGISKTYLIDMPRALNKDKLFQFYSGIESLKAGMVYDDRYHFKQINFTRPRVCIFTNKMPDMNLLSKDMWKIWTIKDNKLEKYETDEDEIDEAILNIVEV